MGGLPWFEGLEPEQPLSRRGFCHQAWAPPAAALCDYLLMSCLSPLVS